MPFDAATTRGPSTPSPSCAARLAISACCESCNMTSVSYYKCLFATCLSSRIASLRLADLLCIFNHLGHPGSG